MVFAASIQTSVGVVMVIVAGLVGITFALVNMRQGKREIGSEIELAPNRKPYYSDEELEGRKLDRTLSLGLLGLFVLGIGLPLYWLQEPGRQANAQGNLERKFIDRGANMFATTEKGGFNCAFCHGEGGVGGVAPYTITDAEGRFVKTVQWKAPALNTVLLRYSRDEVRYILEYGRPFSPMPAWGAAGGGPLTEQNLQNLMDYLQSIQLTPKQSQAQVATELKKSMTYRDATCVAALTAKKKASLKGQALAEFDPTTVDTKSCPPMYKTEGEALVNLGYSDGFAGGAYACARCHTKGWSYGDPGKPLGGAFGPPLTNVTNQFPGDNLGLQAQIDFVCLGSDEGIRYGQNGQGSGRMPGFCETPQNKLNTANGEVGVKATETGLPTTGAMLTQDDVRKIVEYERSLDQ